MFISLSLQFCVFFVSFKKIFSHLRSQLYFLLKVLKFCFLHLSSQLIWNWFLKIVWGWETNNFSFFWTDPICPMITLIFSAAFSSGFHMDMDLFMGSLLYSNCPVVYFDELKLPSPNYNGSMILLSDLLHQGYLRYLVFYINFSLSSLWEILLGIGLQFHWI